MHSRRIHTATLALALSLALPAFAAKNDEVVKPLKTVVQSVRYGKDLLALKNFATEAQGKYLVGADWEKGTDAQRAEFKSLFQSLFGKIAFPKIRENFKHLESVTYEAPKVEGDSALVSSTILILHPLKKQELKLKYKVVQEAGAWKVMDVTVLGDSMLLGIRDDQVQPILKEGGWNELLKVMREKDKELGSTKLK